MRAQYICPAVTAFQPNGQVDMDTMKIVYDRLIAGGLDGIAVMGSSGEFYGMDYDTAACYASESIKYIQGRIPVYVGTGRLSAKETIMLSNHALQQGAYAVMIVGPYYIGCDMLGIEAYYDTVLNQVEGNVVLYNYPDRTGYDLTAETVLSLLKKHKNLIGYKDTVASAAHTRELIQKIKPNYPNFKIYSGYDENFAHVVLSGGDGCIAALSNLAPEICSKWTRALREENMESIVKYQQKIDRMMGFYTITSPFMPAMKYALRSVGVPIGLECILPAVEPNAEQKEKINQLLQEVLNV